MSNLPHRTRGKSEMRLLVVVLTLGFATFIMGHPFRWYFTTYGLKDRLASCPRCVCDCSVQSKPQNMVLTELTQIVLPDCDQRISSTEMRNEVKLHNYQLLSDALKIQETKSEEAGEQSQRALLDVQTTAELYRKELGKCLEGMLTTEDAKDKVEDALKLEKDIGTLWESRARALGWKNEEEQETHTSDDSEI